MAMMRVLREKELGIVVDEDQLMHGCRERMIRMRTPGTHVEMRIGDVAAKPSL